jgi:hypothetical protein
MMAFFLIFWASSSGVFSAGGATGEPGRGTAALGSCSSSAGPERVARWRRTASLSIASRTVARGLRLTTAGLLPLPLAMAAFCEAEAEGRGATEGGQAAGRPGQALGVARAGARTRGGVPVAPSRTRHLEPRGGGLGPTC